jgi:hypothetical protein
MIIKTTDLFDSGVFVDLDELEMTSIQGGSCEYASKNYEAGSTIRQADGVYTCLDVRFWSDRWQRIGD